MNETIRLGPRWYDIETDDQTKQTWYWSSGEGTINILNENVKKIKINFINPPNKENNKLDIDMACDIIYDYMRYIKKVKRLRCVI